MSAIVDAYKKEVAELKIQLKLAEEREDKAKDKVEHYLNENGELSRKLYAAHQDLRERPLTVAQVAELLKAVLP